MDKNKQGRVSRVTEKELELARSAFKDKDELLYAVRAALVGTNFPQVLMTLSDDVIDLIEKITIPEYSDTAPIGGQINMYLNVQVDNMFPEEALSNIEAANRTRDILKKGISNLRSIIKGGEVSGDPSWLEISHEDDDAVVKLKTSKITLATIESAVATLKVMSEKKVEEEVEGASNSTR